MRACRLIPAHAGKTWRACRMIDPDAAHPRSRGENISAGLNLISGVGSSPLTRGKRGLQELQCFRGRLIPAHAGKTCTGLSGT